MTTRTMEAQRAGAPGRVDNAVPTSVKKDSQRAAAAEAACANVILASLPRELREELVSHATMLPLMQGDVVERQGGPNRVFFPLSGMLTGVRTREDGTHYAYLQQGREGAVNAIGVARPEVNVGGGDLVVDVPGKALVLDVDYYRTTLEGSPALIRAVLSHASHMISWREQSADCPGHHPVRARTAYFLLLLRAHAHNDEIEVTHARIAEVLGVRRQSISEALGELKARRVITLDRGRITIGDQAALWQQSCDCRGNVDQVRTLQAAGRFEYTG
jgi:hypothetical protein